MCGIAGYMGRELPGVLDRMMKQVRHRGPDGTGWWHDETRAVHLGHTRLAIQDRAGGAQPMVNAENDLVISFNGEIYNSPELRQRLEALGHRFKTVSSDTEVLLHGYKQWGLDLPVHLNGMWAFALYDRRRRCLILCRDRMGEKPLYYFKGPTAFAFGSELTAVRAHPECPTTVDTWAVKKCFAYGFIPGSRTLLAGVKKLEPGHIVVFTPDDGGSQDHCYWKYRIEPEDTWVQRDAEELAEELAETLGRAVKRQLIGEVGVGVLLSGGLDSSTVATFAAAAQGASSIKSFSLGFAETSFDETVPARTMASWLGTQHHAVRLEADKAREYLTRVETRLDEPIADSSVLCTFALCELARSHTSVVLGGDGGDELFGGYDTFRALRWAERWQRVPSAFQRAIRYAGARLPVSHTNLSWGFKLNRFMRGASLTPPLWHPAWIGVCSPAEVDELFHEPSDPEELYSEAFEAWNCSSGLSTFDRALQFYGSLFLPNAILTKVDRASMLHGLEVRSPFLDLDVVNFARRLPSCWKLRGSSTKYLLKRAMARRLPASVVRRPKKGFGVPIGAWFKQRKLEVGGWQDCPWLTRAWLRAATDAHLQGAADNRQLLWSFRMVGAWNRTSKDS